MTALAKMKLLTKVAAAALLAGGAASGAQAALLTILHNNDGESRLLPVTINGLEYAGASRFVTALNQLRGEAQDAGRDVLTISSGDNFLAGPTFNASLANGVFYDARVLNAIGYDAVVLGNHEFDFGVNTLASFIQQVDPSITFLSSNLDFSNVPSLQALVDIDRIAPTKIVTRGTERYGIIGATTEDLQILSSPGATIVNPVVAAVQAQIDALEADGVNKIIFASHLQELSVDQSVVSQLRGLDLVISGGASALFTNDIPIGGADVYGDAVDGTYPTYYTDNNGLAVPVISTSGEYRYVGQINATFSDAGVLTSIDAGSGPVLINDSFAKDPDIEADVIQPVSEYVAGLAANVIATTDVALDGRRSQVRTRETNLGNLVADGFIHAAQQAELEDATVLTGDAVVSLVNGGGIRNNSIFQPGNITELNTFEVSPFGNFVAVINDVAPEDLKTILEFSVAVAPAENGRFGQVGGLSFSYDPRFAAGSRVFEISLLDGTKVFEDGAFVFDGVFDFITTNFTAAGGDGYPFPALGLGFRNLGITDQLALFNYISDGLDGRITAAQYPAGGEGRINVGAVPEPASWAMMIAGFGLVGGAMRRRGANARPAGAAA